MLLFTPISCQLIWRILSDFSFFLGGWHKKLLETRNVNEYEMNVIFVKKKKKNEMNVINGCEE